MRFSKALAALIALVLAASPVEAQLATTGAGSTNVAVPFTTNLSPATTTQIRAGYQAMLAGTRNMNIAVMEDSTGRGVDETASPYGSQYPLSVAEQLAILFRSDGIAAGANNWYGISGFDFADYTDRDSRVAATGATTAFAIAVPIQGGSEIEFPTAAGTWSFTPQQPVSSCQIYYQDSTAGRQFSWDVDGGAATTITTAGLNTIASATIPLGSVGTHTIRLTWVAAFVRIYGIDCQDATRKEVTIRQWSISGGTTSNMIDNTGTPNSGRLRQMDLNRPDVVAGDFGIINSWRLSRSIANVVLDLTTLFDAIKAAGADFIFVEPPFDSSSDGNAAIQQQYVDAAAALAISKGGIVFRTRQALTSKTVSDSYGYTVANDAVHYRIYGESFRAALMKPMFRYGMGLTPFPDWIVDTTGTTFDFANGRMYTGGTQDTLANDTQNHLVSLRSQSNIHPYSGSLLAGVNWGAIGLGTSGTGVVGPDGAATAFKVVEDGSLGRHLLFGNGAGAATLPIPADSVITIGCTLKAAEDGFAILNGLDNTGANGFFASVNLTTGAVATTGSGFSGTAGAGATFIYATSTDRGNGWWTFSVTGKLPAAATALYPGLDLSNALGANNYQGVPGNGIYASSCNAVVNQTGLIPTASVGLETSAQPSAQLFGTSWTQLPLTGANALTLSGGVYTNAAASGQQAGYLNANQNTGQNVSRIGASWKFTNVGAGNNGAATVVIWKTQPISTVAAPDSGMHLAISRSNWVFGKIIGGNPVVTVASGSFSPALNYGVPLTVDVRINGTTATVNLPDGTTQVVTDADISAAAGPWATIEAFQNDAAADDRIGFYKSWLQ